MPSLRQLLAAHSTLLVVDTCCTRVEVALFRAGSFTPVHVTALEGEASQALPAATQHLLATTALNLRTLAACAFCAGPGSVLGIRLAAASLRAWRVAQPELQLYSFLSLPLLAVAHPDATLIADARRESWHTLRPGQPHTLVRVPTTALSAEPSLATPSHFRRWSTLPAGLVPPELPYSAATLLAAAPDEAFFSSTDAPDAYQPEAASYVTWTPQIHQAPRSTAAHAGAAAAQQ